MGELTTTKDRSVLPLQQMSTALAIKKESLQAYKEHARNLYLAGFAPDTFTKKSKNEYFPEELIVSRMALAMQFGAGIGLSESEALYQIYLINNRPTIYGATVVRLILEHPNCEYLIWDYDMSEEPFKFKDGEKQITVNKIRFEKATATLKLKNVEREITLEYTRQDAELAGLFPQEWDARTGRWYKRVKKRDGTTYPKVDPWCQYPKDMATYKIASRIMKFYLPAIAPGFQIYEDVQEIEQAEETVSIKAEVISEGLSLDQTREKMQEAWDDKNQLQSLYHLAHQDIKQKIFDRVQTLSQPTDPSAETKQIEIPVQEVEEPSSSSPEGASDETSDGSPSFEPLDKQAKEFLRKNGSNKTLVNRYLKKNDISPDHPEIKEFLKS